MVSCYAFLCHTPKISPPLRRPTNCFAMDDPVAVEAVVDEQLGGVRDLDEDIFSYISGIVKDVDSHGCDPETLGETVRELLCAHTTKHTTLPYSMVISSKKSIGCQACIVGPLREFVCSLFSSPLLVWFRVDFATCSCCGSNKTFLCATTVSADRTTDSYGACAVIACPFLLQPESASSSLDEKTHSCAACAVIACPFLLTVIYSASSSL